MTQRAPRPACQCKSKWHATATIQIRQRKWHILSDDRGRRFVCRLIAVLSASAFPAPAASLRAAPIVGASAREKFADRRAVLPIGRSGQIWLACLLALKADPVVGTLLLRAQRRRHHRHSASAANRWAFVIHTGSIARRSRSGSSPMTPRDGSSTS